VLVYNIAKKMLMDGSLNLLNDPVKVMLVGASYVPNADDKYVAPSGAGGAEISGTGYTPGWGKTGRQLLTNKAVAEDDSGDRGYLTADNVTWTAINAGTVQAAILIREGQSDDSTSILIAYIDQGGFPITTNGGDLTIQWSASGILQIT